jgi:hypothetical protein
VQRVVEIIGKQPCVQAYELSSAQATAFTYHGAMNLQLLRSESKCPWLIVDADVEGSLSGLDMTSWQFVTKVRRPTDDNEDVLLYRRVN